MASNLQFWKLSRWVMLRLHFESRRNRNRSAQETGRRSGPTPEWLLSLLFTWFPSGSVELVFCGAYVTGKPLYILVCLGEEVSKSGNPGEFQGAMYGITRCPETLRGAGGRYPSPPLTFHPLSFRAPSPPWSNYFSTHSLPPGFKLTGYLLPLGLEKLFKLTGYLFHPNPRDLEKASRACYLILLSW